MGDRRLHLDVALPVRAADRQHPTQRADGTASRFELRAQQRQGGGRRLHRRRHVLRRRRHRPDRARLAVGVRRPVHAARRDAGRSCASTCGIPRTCSACRPSSTPSTRSTPPSSSRATARGRSRRRRRSTVRTPRPAPTAAPPVAEDEAAGEFATESNTARFTPYYTMFRSGLTGKEEFVILRPFVPFSTNDRRTELQAYLTASSDPETYGTARELRGAAGSAPARAVARRRPGRVGAGHQPAAVAAGERGDAHARGVRRPATRAGRPTGCSTSGPSTCSRPTCPSSGT